MDGTWAVAQGFYFLLPEDFLRRIYDRFIWTG